MACAKSRPLITAVRNPTVRNQKYGCSTIRTQPATNNILYRKNIMEMTESVTKVFHKLVMLLIVNNVIYIQSLLAINFIVGQHQINSWCLPLNWLPYCYTLPWPWALLPLLYCPSNGLGFLYFEVASAKYQITTLCKLLSFNVAYYNYYNCVA